MHFRFTKYFTTILQCSLTNWCKTKSNEAKSERASQWVVIEMRRWQIYFSGSVQYISKSLVPCSCNCFQEDSGFTLWLGKGGEPVCFGDVWSCLALYFERTASGLSWYPSVLPLPYYSTFLILLCFVVVLGMWLAPLLNRKCGLVIFVSWFGVRNVLPDRPSLIALQPEEPNQF